MELLGVKYHNITLKKALYECNQILIGNKKGNIFFLNAACLYLAQKNKTYFDILNHKTDLLLGDGIGIKFISKLLGERMKDNLNGTEFSPKIMELAVQNNMSIFLLGGHKGVAEKAAAKFAKDIGVKIAGTHFGYFDDDESVIRKINTSKADILFVGFGAPRQEEWIIKHRERIAPILCIGVGALFDYHSGRIRRAPVIIRQIYLEWFWRVLMEPRRLFKRYFIDGVKIIGLAIKYFIKYKK